ncbi:hypothetical protein [Halalkalibacter urbisdiaboli]|uniref:hypothetical protein n=1 Tax=Halalkalibacter urbisdiaboli TaxID=1960589 RepID=UPI000B449326|nr:hypothetical protein [Halalkalibacter urbisdiaboli]
MLLIYAIALLLAGLFVVNSVFAYQSKHIDPAFWTTIWYQAKMLPLFFIANILIGYGIKFTHKVIGSLTFTLTFAKGLEILVTILIAYLFMKEVPNVKTALGLAVVIVGFWISRLK